MRFFFLFSSIFFLHLFLFFFCKTPAFPKRISSLTVKTYEIKNTPKVHTSVRGNRNTKISSQKGKKKTTQWEQKKEGLSQKLLSSIQALSSFKKAPLSPSELPIPCSFSIEKKPVSSLEETDLYVDKLSPFLQKNLSLVEKEKVKIEIWIKNTGEVARFTIIEAKKEKNRLYLKKKLPLLQFPCFNERDEIKHYTIYLSAA